MLCHSSSHVQTQNASQPGPSEGSLFDNLTRGGANKCVSTTDKSVPTVSSEFRILLKNNLKHTGQRAGTFHRYAGAV